jgi:hypothetical protein
MMDLNKKKKKRRKKKTTISKSKIPEVNKNIFISLLSEFGLGESIETS